MAAIYTAINKGKTTMNKRQIREMKRMIEYIKTMKELNELLADFNPGEFKESIAKVSAAYEKYKPIKG
jgi:hypothetical protein